MAEYISREDILDIASQYCTDDDGSCSKADVDLREMLDEIEALPAADVQPIRRGRWIYVGSVRSWDEIKCSACDPAFSTEDRDLILNWDFCPNCGARMDLNE